MELGEKEKMEAKRCGERTGCKEKGEIEKGRMKSVARAGCTDANRRGKGKRGKR